MKVVTQVSIDCPYVNRGQRAEIIAYCTLLNKPYTPMLKADNKSFDKDSDISPLRISVKSARFTLASKLYGNTLADMIDDYFRRTNSIAWAYVAKDGNIYIMSKDEFTDFLYRFTTLQKTSIKNGGNQVVRMIRENKIVREWLEAHASN